MPSSSGIWKAAKGTGLERRRLIREEKPSEAAINASCIAEAAAYLSDKEGNILVTTGGKEIAPYTRIPGFSERVYLRVLPTADIIRHCRRLGFSNSRLICMQGPFTEALNRALIEQINARFLVTKDSGSSGGYAGKIEAARKAGIQVLRIARPAGDEGFSFGELMKLLDRQYSAVSGGSGKRK